MVTEEEGCTRDNGESGNKSIKEQLRESLLLWKSVFNQGSVLSSLLFAVIVDVVTKGAREGLMTEIVVYADDLVLTKETIENLWEKFWKWKEAFQIKGMKINLGKTKMMVSGCEGEVLNSSIDSCGVCEEVNG